jgi:integrase
LTSPHKADQFSDNTLVPLFFKHFVTVSGFFTALWHVVEPPTVIIHNFTRQFKEILKLAGIVEKKTFHDLRKTAITGFFHAKMPINDVRILAGHAKLETTCKYYWAAEKDYLDKARQVGQGLYNNEMVEGCWGKGG